MCWKSSQKNNFHLAMDVMSHGCAYYWFGIRSDLSVHTSEEKKRPLSEMRFPFPKPVNKT
eukprot:421164-Amphidinium_carterae.1